MIQPAPTDVSRPASGDEGPSRAELTMFNVQSALQLDDTIMRISINETEKVKNPFHKIYHDSQTALSHSNM